MELTEEEETMVRILILICNEAEIQNILTEKGKVVFGELRTKTNGVN